MPRRNTEVSAFVLRRNASCDMNYMYMCNSNSATHIDVTQLKKHDQVTHLGLGICVSSHRLKPHVTKLKKHDQVKHLGPIFVTRRNE